MLAASVAAPRGRSAKPHGVSLRFDLRREPAELRGGVACADIGTRVVSSRTRTAPGTLPQAIAVAEAVERGLKRREAAGEDVSLMTPACTMMIGRLDDWLQVLLSKDAIATNPGFVHWAGIACVKKAYPIFRERGYRARLLAAAYRHHLHWSEFIGGDIALTIPYKWQLLFNASDIEIVPRMDNPVPEEIVAELYRRFPDFQRAYDVDGMSEKEFDSFGATVRTLRGFISSYQDLVSTIRDFMLPNPDK